METVAVYAEVMRLREQVYQAMLSALDRGWSRAEIGRRLCGNPNYVQRFMQGCHVRALTLKKLVSKLPLIEGKPPLRWEYGKSNNDNRSVLG